MDDAASHEPCAEVDLPPVAPGGPATAAVGTGWQLAPATPAGALRGVGRQHAAHPLPPVVEVLPAEAIDGLGPGVVAFKAMRPTIAPSAGAVQR